MVAPVVTTVDLVHDIPEVGVINNIINGGLSIVGGFPLWLMGGASFASDIDVYAHSKRQHILAQDLFGKMGKFENATPKTIVYRINDTLFQLMNYDPKLLSMRDVLYSTDLSPSACALIKLKTGEYRVQCLYYDDIVNRKCRVLIYHDWTLYRMKTYHKKGYQKFIWMSGA